MTVSNPIAPSIDATPNPTPVKLHPLHGLRALKHRNFQLFVGGQTISIIGTWMTRLATSWLVFKLTGSAFMLGFVGFCSLIPTLLLSPFAGVWVERMERRKLILATQIASCLQSFGLAIPTLLHIITIKEIIALAAFQGAINAFDVPGRQSFLVQMVEGRADLGSAIAINSSMANGGRLVGPAIAGVLIALVGEGYCFLIDAFSYFAVIASLLMMNIKPVNVIRPATRMLHQLHEGWQYVATFRPIRTVLLNFAIISLMAYPVSVLLPLFAHLLRGNDPHALAWLAGASGVGALTSGLSLALRKSVVGLTKMIRLAAFSLGTGLILLGLLTHYLPAWPPTFYLSLLLMLFVGFGTMQTLSASNTVIQSLVPDDKRARVMSYYTIAFVGMSPFGSLFGGVIAEKLSAPFTVILTGLCAIATGLWYTSELPKIRKIIRPIYEELGYLPRKPQAAA